MTVIIATVIAVAFVYFFLAILRTKSNRSLGPIIKTEIDRNQAPTGFPKELPIESGAVIVQNYEAQAPTGQHQATRVFESKKTVAQNYKLYLDYLTKNGWQIKAKTESPALSSIFAVKADGFLTINISKNAITNSVTVDLSLVN